MNKMFTKSLQATKHILQGVRKTVYQQRFYVCEKKDIKKSVFISQSNDVYTNLALEDWFYKNSDFTDHHVLILWQNEPCVVIGRHQNPWEEVNNNQLMKQNINLARRNSGGGTVYHDKGNLNLTFFTSRKHYDRKYNLNLIVQAIFKEFGLQLTVTPKCDILYQDHKVSGTASKLGRNNTYHHCTLLVNVDKPNLSRSLQLDQNNIKSNATKSNPSPVINLSELKAEITVDRLISAIGWEYLRTSAVSLEDMGAQHLSQQKGFQLLNPTEQWFPGLDAICNELKSWEWCYGKTPKFSVNHSFSVPSDLRSQLCDSPNLTVKMFVTNGKIEEVFINIPSGLVPNCPSEDIKVLSNLEGRNYTTDAIHDLQFSLTGVNILTDDNKQFVQNCFEKVMTSV